MKPDVPKKLREAIYALVNGKSLRDLKLDAGMQSVITVVHDDIGHYQYQTEQLAKQGLKPHVAFFRHADDKNHPLPVVVRIPGLDRPGSSQDFMLSWLKDSGISSEAVSNSDAREVFTDRVAEFVTVAAATSSVIADTIVNSNRSGDVVLYAKGYFASTGTAFGTSTPAVRQIVPSGQYSFGIVYNGRPKFDGVLWTTPATVTLKLP